MHQWRICYQFPDNYLLHRGYVRVHILPSNTSFWTGHAREWRDLDFRSGADCADTWCHQNDYWWKWINVSIFRVFFYKRLFCVWRCYTYIFKNCLYNPTAFVMHSCHMCIRHKQMANLNNNCSTIDFRKSISSSRWLILFNDTRNHMCFIIHNIG